jgi:hypothetical protein
MCKKQEIELMFESKEIDLDEYFELMQILEDTK